MKYLSIFLCLFLLTACKKQVEQVADNSEQTATVTDSLKLALTKFRYPDYRLDSKALPTVSQWPAYTQLQGVVDQVKVGDLSFFKENKELLDAMVNDLKTTMPEAFNNEAVMARLTIVETFGYKLENEVMLSRINPETLELAAKEFLVSVSNLNFQINKKFEKEAQNIIKP